LRLLRCTGYAPGHLTEDAGGLLVAGAVQVQVPVLLDRGWGAVLRFAVPLAAGRRYAPAGDLPLIGGGGPDGARGRGGGLEVAGGCPRLAGETAQPHDGDRGLWGARSLP
jgi:hypothetical protein